MKTVKSGSGWWVTTAQSDLDGWNALALANSLKLSLTAHEQAIVVSRAISREMRLLLSESFDFVLDCPCACDWPRLSPNLLLQLAVWKCSAKTGVFILPNSLVLKNCDELFELEGNFMAAPASSNDDETSSEFDASLFMFKPNALVFEKMCDQLSTSSVGKSGSVDKALNTYFGSEWKEHSKLGLQYTCAIVGVIQLERFLPNQKIVHFEKESNWWLSFESDERVKCWTQLFFQQFLCDSTLVKQDETIQRYLKESIAKFKIPNGNKIQPLAMNPHLELLATDSVAIIGLSCRLPGANNEEEFWEVLYEGRDETKPLPLQRYFTKPSDFDPNEAQTPAGYLKCPIDEFDAKFFEISRREAEYMDPQQRLLLEVAWESLENAGINPQSLMGSNAAVFAGIWAQEYVMHITREAHADGGRDFQHKYLGNALCASPARISHFLGLTGPSVVMEAGCASALEGLHYACESLRSRESDLAISCGANIALTFTGAFSSLDSFILSKDGKCKTFDEAANGFARGEAAVSLILKRTADAVRDGNNILAVIRGSAVNNDGSGSAMGTPNAAAQEAVIKQALDKAGLSPNDVSYVEAHGTGTPVGDPIEFHALNQVFGGGMRPEPLLVSSVKTNIGHTEGCSGLSGLVKVLMCLRNRIIPKHLHLKNLNQYIKLDEIPAVIPQENTKWKASYEGGLVAGLSSFGLSGTNVHVILQEPPAKVGQPSNVTPIAERPQHIFTLSAKSESALSELAQKYEALLESQPEINLADLAFSANTGRAQLRNRMAAVAKDSAQLLHRLKTGYFSSGKVGSNPGQLAFLFTGQGSQYIGMGQTLYKTQPVFKTSLDKCAKLLSNRYKINLFDVIFEGTCPLDDSMFSQPAIFCIEVALADLWRSFGVTPDFVLGHSVGEFAAAVVCGMLSLGDGLALVVERSRLVNGLSKGAMMVLRKGEAKVREVIKEFELKVGAKSNWVDIAAVNSSEEVVVSGLPQAVDSFEQFCREKGVGTTQRLAASHAFHSRQMEEILESYRLITQKVGAKSGTAKFISATWAKELLPSELDSTYWLSHLRQPVRFLDAFVLLQEAKCSSFIEVGAQPVLLALGMGIDSSGAELVWCPSIRKQEDNWTTLLASLVKVYMKGHAVDWEGFDAPYQRLRFTDLPNYAWQRESYWFSGKSSNPESMQINCKAVHPILGRRVPIPFSDRIVYYNSLSLGSLSYIRDHKVADRIVLPGAAYVETILAAGLDVISGGTSATIPIAIENLTIESALELKEDCSVEIQTVLTPSTEDDQLTYQVTIYKQVAFDPSGSDGGKWKKLVSATFIPCYSTTASEGSIQDLEALKASLTQRETIDDIYTKIAEMGIVFGPLFKSIKRAWYSESEFLIETVLPEGSEAYLCHPIVFDAMIQACVASMALNEKEVKGLYLPLAIQHTACLPDKKPSETLFIHCGRLAGAGQSSSVTLFNETGESLAVMEGVDLVQTTVPTFLRLIASDSEEFPGFFEDLWIVGSKGPREQRVVSDGTTQPDVTLEPHVIEQIEELERFFGPILPKLFSLSYLYICRALVQVGWKYRVGDRMSVQKFLPTTSVLPKHRQLMERWFEILEEEGHCRALGDCFEEVEYVVLKEFPNLEEIEAQISELISWCEAGYDSNEHRFIAQCGEHLAAIIQGKLSPYIVLFPGDSGVAGAASFYRVGSMKFLHEMSAETLVKIMAQLNTRPGKKTFRILEIGAGTGSATEHALDKMDAAGITYEYTVTDISPLLLNECQQKLSAGGRSSGSKVLFSQLDIESDPKAQGFPPHYYDIVVADNVLHATKSLSDSLKNVRHLLVPNGAFVFTELVKKSRMMDVSFGVLDGWWRFSDFDVRKNYPAVNVETWLKLLQDHDFVNPMEYGNDTGAEKYEYRVIGASANSKRNTIPAASDVKPIWFLLGDQGQPFSQLLCAQFRLASKSCVFVDKFSNSNSSDASVRSISAKTVADNELISFEKFCVHLTKDSTDQVPVEGIIFLWGLPCQGQGLYLPDLSNENNETLSCIERTGQLTGEYLHLVHALLSSAAKIKPSVFVVTKGATFVTGDEEPLNPLPATLWGMAQTFNNEFSSHKGVAIDIDPSERVENSVHDLFHQLWLNDAEHQVAFRKERKYVKRLVHSDRYLPSLVLPAINRYSLNPGPSGSFAEFFIAPAPMVVPGSNEIEVKVACCALNFKDIIVALSRGSDIRSALGAKGLSHKAGELGLDFAGTVVSVGSEVGDAFKVGDRVFGLVPGGALASHVVVDKSWMRPIPDEVSFEEASTVGSVFLTALFFLVSKGKLSKDDKVLIHTGSGGVGLAAIQVAKAIGAEIFTTAGSRRKRSYLRGLGIKHVYNSRTTEYGQQIMKDTDGVGVNVVLNSLTGPNFKETTLAATAPGARFLEMSKLNAWTEEEVKAMRPDVYYFIQEMDKGDVNDAFGNEIESIMLQVEESYKKGLYTPLPFVTFPFSRVHDAFTYLQEARHIGKVVIKFPETRLLSSGGVEHVQHLFSANGSYLITGGLGGIGLEVAKWMANAGAGFLVLAGRSAPSARAEQILSSLKAANPKLKIVVLQADVSDFSQCQALMGKISEVGFPPLRGVMHAAGVLHDGLMLNQTPDFILEVLQPKVQGTWNLHVLTKDLPLEHFVLFSSMVAVFGGLGQCNHCAANKYLDEFAKYRHLNALPCTSINWGAWSDVGKAAEVGKNFETSFGIRMFTPAQGIASLQRIIQAHGQTNKGVMDIADFKVLTQIYNVGSFFGLLKSSKESGRSSKEFEKRIQAIKECEPHERLAKVKEFMEFVVRDTLKLPDTEPIDHDQDLKELGIDSLMAMEIRSKVQPLLQLNETRTISVSELQESRTINKLTQVVMNLINEAEESKQLSPEELAALIKADSVLPEDIQLPNQADITDKGVATESSCVLLTGATGHLGPYILAQLLQRKPSLKVVCLIRATSDENAKERLIAALKDVCLVAPLENVVCVAGNLGQGNFGLSQEKYDELSLSVDSVIHCAWLSNSAMTYGSSSSESLRTNNVFGLLNVLRFCCTSKPKALLTMSNVYALSTLTPEGTFPDDFPAETDFGETLKVGSQIAKFICEKLVKEAVARGLSVVVLRNHHFLGDSKTGLLQPKRNYMSMLLLACKQIGLFPKIDSVATGVPVDIVAQVSVRMFLLQAEGKAESGVYNVNNPKTTRVMELVEVFRGKGFEFKLVSYDEWRIAYVAAQAPESAAFLDNSVKDIFNSDAFKQHALTGPSLSLESAMFENSPKMKRLIPDIDQLMVDPIQLAEMHLAYYEKVMQNVLNKINAANAPKITQI